MAFNKTPKVVTRFIDTYEYESVNQSGNVVKIDMYDGENKKHFGPTELLLSAVATCAAVDVAEIMQKRRKTFEEFEVVTDGIRREEHPRVFTDIILTFRFKSDNITEQEVVKQAKTVVEKYCSVASTVSGVAKIDVRAEIY